MQIALLNNSTIEFLPSSSSIKIQILSFNHSLSTFLNPALGIAITEYPHNKALKKSLELRAGRLQAELDAA